MRTTPSPRHPQWEQRLHEFVLANIARPYVWSQHDCLIFAANVAKAVIGKDFAKGHRGKYKSHASAYSYLRKAFGVKSPEALLDTLFPRKAVGFAGIGDLVLCRVDLAEGADGAPTVADLPGLCMGAFALIAGETGLIKVPRGDRWLKAWAVGEHHSGEMADG
jgi:hypothetical protein